MRRVVFYSEGSSNWPHFEGIIMELLEKREIIICYFSSSEDDPAFTIDHPRLHTFKTDFGFTRNWLFENLKFEIVVMTMPDIDNFQVKRSKKAGHYIYVQHSLVSLHMIYRLGAFDNYDTIFCCGEYHKKEIRAMEKYNGTKRKQLIEHGYGLLDKIMKDKNIDNQRKIVSKTPTILLAPSWGENCIIETIGEELIEILINENFKVILRPHPQTLKFSKDKIDSIMKLYFTNPNFSVDTNISSQDSMRDADLMISDWSGVAFEYVFGHKKPVVFIDMPRKVNNPDYEHIHIEPFEVTMRSELGELVQRDDISQIGNVIRKAISSDTESLGAEKWIYNVGRSSVVAADYITEILERSN